MLIRTRADIQRRQGYRKSFYSMIFKSFFFMLKEARLGDLNTGTKGLDNHLFISLKLAQVVVETMFDIRITYSEIIDLMMKNRPWIESSVEIIIARYFTTYNENIEFDLLTPVIKKGVVEMNYYKNGIMVYSETIKHPYPKLDLSIFDLNSNTAIEKRLSVLFTQVKRDLPGVYEGHIQALKYLKRMGYKIHHSKDKLFAMDLLFAHYKGVMKKYVTVKMFFKDYFSSDKKRQQKTSFGNRVQTNKVARVK